MAGFHWPHRLFAEDRDIGHALRPADHPLRAGHEPHHAPRIGEIGTQERHSEAKPRDRLPLRLGPEGGKLSAQRLLHRAAQGAAVIEISQVLHVQMHCRASRYRSLLIVAPTGYRENTMTLQIVTIPCLSDNYAYLAHDPATGATAAVDVPEAAPIIAELKAQGWTLSDVLLTHHHADHVQGLPDLLAFAPARIIGAAADAHRLPPLDIAIGEGDTVHIGQEEGRVIDVSGHTVGHVAFHFPKSDAIFTADSLMALGCGRVFEGTMEQMHESLEKLATLPPETVVYSGHEYTLNNAKFALTVDPDNPRLKSRIKEIDAKCASGKPTVPSTLAEELATNPFLRASDPDIQSSVGMTGAAPGTVFAEIRARKDRF